MVLLLENVYILVVFELRISLIKYFNFGQPARHPTENGQWAGLSMTGA